MGDSALQTRICNKYSYFYSDFQENDWGITLKCMSIASLKFLPNSTFKIISPLHSIEEVMQNVCMDWHKAGFFFISLKINFMWATNLL